MYKNCTIMIFSMGGGWGGEEMGRWGNWVGMGAGGGTKRASLVGKVFKKFIEARDRGRGSGYAPSHDPQFHPHNTLRSNKNRCNPHCMQKNTESKVNNWSMSSEM